jgi:surfeit locus 1 family protein
VRRIVFPVLLGVLGCAVLIALGTWQLRRLEWKEAILAQIEARIAADPVALPVAVDPEADRYLPVTVTGALGGEEMHVLTSLKDVGPGYRVISVMTSGDRRVLVDLGFVPEELKNAPRMAESVTVTGNLHWPQETDGWTPDPDTDRDIWFARDVGAMAGVMGAEDLMVIAREVSGPVSAPLSAADLGVTPLPIDTATIPNDHLNYAITWFSLAVVWAVMSGVLIWRAIGTGRKGTV